MGGAKVQIYTDLFPKEICEYIKAHYKGTGYQEMADILKQEFGREYTKGQIRSFYRNRHLDSGLKGNLEKGRGWNRGKKMSPEHYEKSKGTMFKKGNRPHNAVPVGTEVIRDDGYHQTKIAEPNKWILTHILIWQQAYGEVPKGHHISFKDGNRDHIELSNLFLETKQEHLEMNRRGLRSTIPEITETGHNIAKLNVAISKRLKSKKNLKEDKPMKRTKENPTRFTASRYKEIKHLDQEQMKKAVNDYYWQGFNDGQAAAGLDIDKAIQAVSQIEGIGPVKLSKIEKALKGACNGNETK